MKTNGTTVVVGAGISGLYAALQLKQRGRDVRILERQSHPGGLAGAHQFRGVPCDLGSHRIHPDALVHPLFAALEQRGEMLIRPRRGRLVLGQRHLKYPPNAMALLGTLGPVATAAFAFDLLTQPARRRAWSAWERERARARRQEDDIGFADFVSSRVGNKAYQAFYRPYAEKVWGLPAEELSQTVAKKRFSFSRPLTLIQGRVGRLLQRASRGPIEKSERFAYPAGGISSIIDYLLSELAERGVEPEYGAKFEPNGSSGPVLFSGNIADLVDTELEHRGIYLVYLALPTSKIDEVETYYSPDPDYWFGRVADLQNYSPELHRGDETVLCVEIPEGAWGPDQDFTKGAKRDTLVGQLQRARIIPEKMEPVAADQVYLSHVYPLYRRGWLKQWRETLRRIDALPYEAMPFGRQGLFLHCNLDHCAAIADDVVEHVSQGRPAADWLAGAEKYIDLRVRD
ncbi:MAG: FAD-dependent oxidoreductase [Myxococcota bacterium]